jgi:hemoglobin-like flavoprotein
MVSMMFKLFGIAPNRIKLIEDSFFKISNSGQSFATSFYHRFFELYPDIQPMFKNADQPALELKLMRTLSLIVENLRRPDTLVPMLEALGKRHRLQYRVVAPHYAMLSEALVKTISDYSGADWNPALETAWAEAIDGITEIMIYQV